MAGRGGCRRGRLSRPSWQPPPALAPPSAGWQARPLGEWQADRRGPGPGPDWRLLYFSQSRSLIHHHASDRPLRRDRHLVFYSTHSLSPPNLAPTFPMVQLFFRQPCLHPWTDHDVDGTAARATSGELTCSYLPGLWPRTAAWYLIFEKYCVWQQTLWYSINTDYSLNDDVMFSHTWLWHLVTVLYFLSVVFPVLFWRLTLLSAQFPSCLCVFPTVVTARLISCYRTIFRWDGLFGKCLKSCFQVNVSQILRQTADAAVLCYSFRISDVRPCWESTSSAVWVWGCDGCSGGSWCVLVLKQQLNIDGQCLKTQCFVLNN